MLDTGTESTLSLGTLNTSLSDTVTGAGETIAFGGAGSHTSVSSFAPPKELRRITITVSRCGGDRLVAGLTSEIPDERHRKRR